VAAVVVQVTSFAKSSDGFRRKRAMRIALKAVASDLWLVAGVVAQATSFAKSKRRVSPSARDEDRQENSSHGSENKLLGRLTHLIEEFLRRTAAATASVSRT
jgi:hypothetical protein